MPGMMDTVLNLGLNDDIVKGLVKHRGEKFAYDCYRRVKVFQLSKGFHRGCPSLHPPIRPSRTLMTPRRLLQMFGDVVLSIPNADFEACLSATKAQAGVR